MLRDVVIDIIDIDFSNPFERSCYGSPDKVRGRA